MRTHRVRRFGIGSDLGKSEISTQKKTLRCFLLSESRRTLPHPHNRLVVGSSPTGPTILIANQTENSEWGIESKSARLQLQSMRAMLPTPMLVINPKLRLNKV